MGYLYQPKLKTGGRCKKWWAKYYINGMARRESLGTEDHEEAKQILKVKEGRVAEGKPPLPRADKIRFEELAEDYLTDYRVNGKRSLTRAEYNVEGLKLSFAGWRAVDINTADVKAHIARRQADGCANGTINRELAGLKRMFRLALQAEKLSRAPYIPLLQEHNVRTGFFSDADYLAIREALPEYLRLPVDFAYKYGWRRSEVFGLTWGQVDLTRGTVQLDPGTTKNGEGRLIRLTPELLAMLKAQRARTAQAVPWVFHKGGRQITDFRKLWLRRCEKAKLAGRIFHDFRRTAIRNMIRLNIPERVAMKISGHKTRSIFERYNIVSEGDLEEAAAKLAGTFSGTFAPSAEAQPQEIR